MIWWLTGLRSTILGALAFGADATAQSLPLEFQGRMLVTISDADMPASAYKDDLLGPQAGRDALSVISLGRSPQALVARDIEVSNSVVGSPAALAVTPDGRYAIVVEALKQRPAGVDRLSALKPGSTICLVDLAAGDHPRVIQRLEAPGRPDTVAINADGSLVAVTLMPDPVRLDRPLALYRFERGKLGATMLPVITGWGGDRLVHATFHPKENLLALVNSTRQQVSFAKVDPAAPDKALVVWGNPVGIDRSPYLARFTPDGRHVLVNALYVGYDVLDDGSGAPLGTLLSIRLNVRGDANGTPRHALISRAQTGIAPEGFAISPDGRLVVTTNLERTALPFNHARLSPFASLSLLRLDPESGVLSRVGEFAFDGILPESVVFDNSSRFLAVTNFDHFDQSRRGGTIDIWRIASDPYDSARLFLVRTDYRVKVARGAHTLAIVR